MRPLIRFSDVRLAGVAFSKRQAIGGTGKLIEGVKRGARRLRALVRRCCFWAPVLALSACSTLEVSPFLKEQITGDSWKACLAREYQAQARFQVRYGRNWDEGMRLSDKGRMALAGSEITPWAEPASLSARRTQLDQAIASSGRTCGCAKAQAALDGWILALEQDPDRDQATFAERFDGAKAECEARK
jgi:hypothetical protein